MSNQTIGVNLKFSADVSAAKKAMAELQGSLAQIHNAAATSSNPGIKFAKDLNQASQAAAQLRVQLQNAFNQDTGKLNLTKFNMEMKQSGMSVEKYRAALASIGPQGQQAFTQLAHAIATADTQTISLSTGLQRLGTTFMNTFRYQLSSSVLMAFTSGISEAVKYVKDLNSSLNDIRIVTDYGADRMKDFAAEANKAAKALSTTTNEYAKASLIYFQQGLNDADVKRRTDLTIKMANVTGQAVSEVSDQLTAVWNNFDNGTKSLDHYVDVMVALGAATASSSEEISEGLNKFAAVAETVGLSYEYAASALATVTAETRQSADVVGTAFKTLFARIQDLELGKTLDDGTTLGQYSQALKAVGINIKDANGEVKDMNSILDEIGAKWNTLSKDAQIALAQNVAGTRQYTQLIALMDNWEVFQKNLNTANTSSGALQKQADVYAESWEAASERVKASLETIYNQILDDKFFIKATDALADFIDLFGNLIEGLGGMPGLLALIGGTLTKVFSVQLSSSLNNTLYGIRSLTKAGKAENARVQNEFAEAAAKGYGTTGASGQQGVLAKEEARLQEIFIRNKGKMNELERSTLEIRIAELKTSKQQLNNEIEQTKSLEKRAQTLKKISQNNMNKENLQKREGYNVDVAKKANKTNKYLSGGKIISGVNNTAFVDIDEKQQNKIYDDLKRSSASKQISDKVLNIKNEDTFASLSEGSTASIDKQAKALDELKSRLRSLGVTKEKVDAQMKDEVGDELAQNYQELAKAIDASEDAIKKYNQAVETGASNQDVLKQNVEKANAAVREAEQNLYQHAQEMQTDATQAAYLAGATQSSIEAQIQLGTTSGDTKTKMMELGQQYEQTGKKAEISARKVSDFGGVVTNLAQGISGLSMAVTSLKGIFDVLNDEDMSFWDKLLSIVSTLGMTIPMVMMAIKSLNTIEWKSTAGKALNAAATWGQVQAENALQKERDQTTRKTVKQTIVEGVKTAKDSTKKGLQGIGNKWNDAALSNNSQFELQTTGKNKGMYKILEGDGAGSFADKKLAGKMAGKNALKGLGKGLGKAGLSVAVIAATIAAGAAIYKMADEAYNRDERAAQRAEAAAKDLADAYGKAADKYNELNEASKKYADGVNSLKDLTKGTLEYEEAISSSNEEALKLINTYDELAGQYHTTAEGLIVFNEGALESIRLLELQRKNAAAAASTLANQNAREARTQSDVTNFLREDIKSNERSEVTKEDWAQTGKGTGLGLASGAAVGAGAAIIGSVAAGTGIGATLGSSVPVIGTIIGAAVGVIVGTVAGVITAVKDQKEATQNEQKAIEALSKEYNLRGNSALSPDEMKKILEKNTDIENKAIDDLVGSLSENSEELEKLMQEIKANTEAKRIENANLARQIFTSQDAGFSTFAPSTAQAIAQIAGDYTTKRGEEIEYKNRGDRKSESFTWGANDGTAWGEKTVKEYLEAQGFTDVDAQNFKKNSVKVRYFNKETNDYETKDINYEIIAAWKESQTISQELSDQYQNIRNTVFKLSQKSGGEGIISILGNQDINTLTKDQYEELSAAYRSGNFDKELKELGKKNGQNYVDAVEKAINSWDSSVAFNNFAKKTRQEIDTILQGGASETGYNQQALENYSLSLLENSKALNGNGEALDEWQKTANKKIAAEMAVANAKFAKGVVSLTEVLNDSAGALTEWNEASLDTWEAVGKVQEALKGVFGVNVSADFVEKNLSKIKQLAAGNVSVLEELQQEAAKDFVINLDISQESKNNLSNMLDLFIKQTELESEGLELDVGAKINLDSYTQQLNKMLEAGDMTAEEVKNMFAAIGYAVDIKTTKRALTSTSHYTVTKQDGSQETYDVSTTTVTDVPYIAGENTSELGQDITTSTGETVTVGHKEKGTGITYTGGENIKQGLLTSQKLKKENLKELDRYRDINEALSDMERLLKKISDAKEKAFGRDKLRLIEQDLVETNKQLILEQKLLNDRKKAVKEAWIDLDNRFTIDPESGRITNSVEVLTSVADTAEYATLKEQADKYTQALNDLESQQETINQLNDKIQNLPLEKIDAEVELNVSISKRSEKYFEYLMNNLNDPFYDAAKTIELLGSTMDGQIDNFYTYVDGIKNVLEDAGVASEKFDDLAFFDPEYYNPKDFEDYIQNVIGAADFTTAQITQLEKYADGLMAIGNNMAQFYSDVMEKVNDAFENMNNDAERAVNRVEQLGSTLETLQNIIDLTGKKSLGVTNEQIKALSKAKIAQSKATLEATQTQLNMNQQSLADAKKFLAEAEANWDEDAVKYWKEQINTIEDKVWELEEEVNTAWTNTLQSIADEFTAAVELAASEFEESMTGVWGTYDKMQEYFDQQSEIGDRYLANYQKIYELSKLNRSLNQSIDDTDSIKGKQALRDLQEEINSLQESDAEMSQYDLEHLQKKYDLRLAEIALEEAQNAKSQVRMRRDSEGNYSYVYTADEEKTTDATQNYEDKLYELQQHGQEYIKEMSSQIIQTEVEMQEAISAIDRSKYSDEEYEAEVLRITQYYSEKRNYYLGELNKALTDHKITFTDTLYAQTTGYADAEESRAAFDKNMSEMIPKLTQAFQQWQKDAKETFSLVDKDFDDFTKEGGTFDTTVNTVTSKLGEVNTELSKYSQTATSAFQGIVSAAANQLGPFSNSINKYIEQINRVVKALTEGINTAEQKTGDAMVTPDEFPVDTSGEGYYGTYKINGTTYRTSKMYNTKEEALMAAEEERDAFDGHESIKQKYYASIGQLSPSEVGKIEASEEDDSVEYVKAASESDYQAYDTNDIASKKGGLNTATYLDVNNRALYISEDTDITNVERDLIGRYIVTAYGKKYVFKETDFIKMINEVGKEKFKKSGILSGSGDFIFEDATYDKLEPKDRVKLSKQVLNNQLYYYAITEGEEADLEGFSIFPKSFLPEDARIEEIAGDDKGVKYAKVPSSYKTFTGKKKYVWVKLQDLVSAYDTGGYTGEWDSSGRLAMLHQKEIVLNAHDTENFLAAVNIVRDITRAIDLRALAYQNELSKLGCVNAMGGATQTLDQQVTIHAEFPNVRERSEIEAAFDNLINRASQFANRKN